MTRMYIIFHVFQTGFHPDARPRLLGHNLDLFISRRAEVSYTPHRRSTNSHFRRTKFKRSVLTMDGGTLISNIIFGN